MKKLKITVIGIMLTLVSVYSTISCGGGGKGLTIDDMLWIWNTFFNKDSGTLQVKCANNVSGTVAPPDYHFEVHLGKTLNTETIHEATFRCYEMGIIDSVKLDSRRYYYFLYQSTPPSAGAQGSPVDITVGATQTIIVY